MFKKMSKNIKKFILFLERPLFRFVASKRGTTHALYDGNTYTPNEKMVGLVDGKRTWKCSQYYKQNCKARISTMTRNGHTFVKNFADHSHHRMYQTKEEINNVLNYR